MKRIFSFSVTILIGSFSLNAGSLFGPPPFRNGSTLLTGNDGNYQAAARATNLTGVIKFTYSGGLQTVDDNDNEWIFFVNGEIFKGLSSVAIAGKEISGVMDSGAISIKSSQGDPNAFPIVLVTGGSDAAGSFQGKINFKSPSGEFSGTGNLVGSQFAGLEINTINLDTEGVPWSGFPVSIGPSAANPLPDTPFQFRGVRTAIPNPNTTSTTTTN